MSQLNGKLDRKPVSLEARQRLRRARLSIKQERFIQAYARSGNGAGAAREAGYKPAAAKQIAFENLTKPDVKAALSQEMARIALEVSPDRVRRRLDEISHAAQDAGQFGPAVRAVELLGRSVGMFIDRSLQLTGQLNDTHIQALIEVARRRQTEPIDLTDEETES
jgi:terminase small subunit-like protein